MIGSDIRKYAERRGLHCDGGIAYGVVHGLHIALSGTGGREGLGGLPLPARRGRAGAPQSWSAHGRPCSTATRGNTACGGRTRWTVEAGVATVTFADALGANAARGALYRRGCCPRLDAPAGDRCAPLRRAAGGRRTAPCCSRGRALPVHAACAGEMARRIQQAPKRPDRAVRGLLGALAGGLLGAVAWAAAYALGCVTSFAGLLIGFPRQPALRQVRRSPIAGCAPRRWRWR